MSGRTEEALEQSRVIGARPDSPTFYRTTYAHALAVALQHDEATAILDEIEAARPRRYASPLQLATVAAALGDNDRAFRYLDEGLATRAWQMVVLGCDARLDPLRGDSRFQRLLEAVGLRKTSPER